MESAWDNSSYYLHKIDRYDYKGSTDKECNLSLLEFCNMLKAVKGRRSRLVFHAQGSLPYLILALFVNWLHPLKWTIIYDVHDLHEKNIEHSIYRKIRYSFIRYYILLFAEYLVFQVDAISKITVSKGLSELISQRYGCSSPAVVYNLGGGDILPINQCRERHYNFVYFGGRNRVPVNLLKTMKEYEIELHLYGRDITVEWLDECVGFRNPQKVKAFGPYDPDDLSFLLSYKALLIYEPANTSNNFKYSMPNKFFQALKNGLVIVISSNFAEMFNEMVESLPDSFYVVESQDDLKEIDHRMTMMRNLPDLEKRQRWLEEKLESSKQAYKLTAH